MVKVSDDQVVKKKPAYIAIDIDGDGEKHVLGNWLAKKKKEKEKEEEGER